MNKVAMVVDAHAVGMIAVIRSLGRAGYSVVAIDENPKALGFKSNFVAESYCCPPLYSSKFVPWLSGFIAEHGVDVIVPSEGFLHSIGEHYEEYSRLLPDAVPLEIWRRCLSKVATQVMLTSALPESEWHLPHAGIVSEVPQLPGEQALHELRGPFYVKADAGLSKGEKEAQVLRCETVAEMRETVHWLLKGYQSILWQQHVPGKKVGVSLWRHKGEIIAENMTLGIHMDPWRGGMMSLRKSFWHDKLLEDAKGKMELLGWQGVAMMEYKWDPITDEFWFIEINARYWGYLHLDLFADKDFPKLQVDAFFGHVQNDLGEPADKYSSRHTVPGEISYLLSRLKDKDLGLFVKIKSIAGFFLRFLDFRTKSDLWFPEDRLLYLRCLAGYLRQLFTR